MWVVWMGAVLLGVGKRRNGPLARAVKQFVESVMVNRPTGSREPPHVRCIKMSLFLGSVLNEGASVCVLKVVNPPAAGRQTSLFGRRIVGAAFGVSSLSLMRPFPGRGQGLWESPHARTHGPVNVPFVFPQ